jgi:hypothetical protein
VIKLGRIMGDQEEDLKDAPIADAVGIKGDADPSQGIIAGIKVDTGAKPLAGSPGESVTEEWMRDQRILTAPPIAVSGATTDRHERPISSSAGPAATALCQLYDIEPGRR